MDHSEMLKATLREYTQDEIQDQTLFVLQSRNEYLTDLIDNFCKMRAKQTNRAEVACFYELGLSNVGEVVGNQDREHDRIVRE